MKYVTKAEMMEYLDSIAPFDAAEEWDNAGLDIDMGKVEYKKVLVAFDPTPETGRKAAELGCDLVITHHPALFTPLRKVKKGDFDSDTLISFVQGGVSLIACHTNLDKAAGGVNDVLAREIGLTDVSANGMVRIGGTGGATLEALAKRVKTALGCPAVRYVGDPDRIIKKAAVCGGSGMSLVGDIMDADVFITAEIKHHEALAAQNSGLCLIDAGHFETEVKVAKALFEGLQTRFSHVEYNTEFILADFMRNVFNAL